MIDIERACEIMHDAYERAAVRAGWETNPASRRPWAQVPEANKVTMRAAVAALLDDLGRDVLLTTAEHRAMDLTADLYNTLAREVVADGISRESDLYEIAADIHHIQQRILAQAGARAFPDRYRLLGSSITRDVPTQEERSDD